MNIEFKGITHAVKNREVFCDLNAQVSSGQCLVISGRSGCGKTLFFSIASDIIRPDKGQMLIDSVAVNDMNAQKYSEFRRNLGVVFQLSGLISNLTLEENLMLPLNRHYKDVSKPEKQERIRSIAREFALEHYLTQRTEQLSSGQASLAGLARALLLKPKAVVWDAPMAEIDDQWSQYVLDLLLCLKQQGTTLILCSNRKEVIEKLADTQLELNSKVCFSEH
ncbi:ATP-binding cassette domain-containing protein [Pseudoalteromonas luteoviolacea]|uniref:ATP-binding cassette domain-containing protein n=1 Tax=Pseudoalteromonas luteoviolacea TaxID=43657 RepID=UPI0011540C0A|nr:ATP-binding cassette domain-containing protein [Pseudoalteromonas luteoviolacea]TQF71037.1 ATP-binding cassette domain-containing protein [Pseudoalteromonas luteoviolacea]